MQNLQPHPQPGLPLTSYKAQDRRESPVPSRRLVEGVGGGNWGGGVQGSFSRGSLSTRVAGPELPQREAQLVP